LDTVKKALQAEITEIHALCIDATARADNEEALKKHWIAEKHASDDIVISKDKEIGELKKTISEHNKLVTDLKYAAEAQEKKIEERSKKVHLLEVEAATADKHRKGLETEIEELKKQLEKEFENHQVKVLPLDSQIAELRKWLDEALAKNTALTKERNNLEEDLKEKDKRLDIKTKAEADLRERKLPLVENEVKKLEVLVRTKNEEIEELKKRLASVVEEFGKQLAVLEKEVEMKNTLVQQLKIVIEQHESHIEYLTQQLHEKTEAEKLAMQKVDRLEFDLNSMSKILQEHKKEVKDLKYTLDVADKALEDMERKEKALHKQLSALELEHSHCYAFQQCGIGMKLYQENGDMDRPVVKMGFAVCGGSVWREQINNPNFRLKRGDIILEIDGKALVSVDGVGKLIKGLESSTVTLKIQDSLGVYDATLTRRVNYILHPDEAWETIRKQLALRDMLKIQAEENEKGHHHRHHHHSHRKSDESPRALSKSGSQTKLEDIDETSEDLLS